MHLVAGSRTGMSEGQQQKKSYVWKDFHTLISLKRAHEQEKKNIDGKEERRHECRSVSSSL